MKKYIVEVHEKNDKYSKGTVTWKNEAGQLHREGGPAIEGPSIDDIDCPDGFRGWWINDELHSVDGSDYWYINGKRHREDGPAVERPNGEREWYLNDVRYTEKEFLVRTPNKEFLARAKKELTVSEIENLLGYSIKIIRG